MPTRLLEFDPTPAGLVTRPLSKAYKSVWTSLRRTLLTEHGAVCQVCKYVAEAPRHIHCHEVYAFPDTKVVRLERVVLLCWRCHDATHFERTQHRCGQKYVQEIAAHYREVNGGLSEKAFERDLLKAYRCMQAIRKSYGGPAAAPLIDYGPYQIHVDEFMEGKKNRECEAVEDDMVSSKCFPITSSQMIPRCGGNASPSRGDLT
jgi:hypothetical protein